MSKSITFFDVLLLTHSKRQKAFDLVWFYTLHCMTVMFCSASMWIDIVCIHFIKKISSLFFSMSMNWCTLFIWWHYILRVHEQVVWMQWMMLHGSCIIIMRMVSMQLKRKRASRDHCLFTLWNFAMLLYVVHCKNKYPMSNLIQFSATSVSHSQAWLQCWLQWAVGSFFPCRWELKLLRGECGRHLRDKWCLCF